MRRIGGLAAAVFWAAVIGFGSALLGFVVVGWVPLLAWQGVGLFALVLALQLRYPDFWARVEGWMGGDRR